MNSTDRLRQAAANDSNYDSDTEQLPFVSEDNYREFLQHVDNSVKLQLLRNSEYLIQFSFKREAQQFNANLRARASQQGSFPGDVHPYTNEEIGKTQLPFQHLLWAADLSKETQISKSLIHCVYMIAVEAAMGGAQAIFDGITIGYANGVFSKLLARRLLSTNERKHTPPNGIPASQQHISEHVHASSASSP